jgi:hypothetical protein
MVKKIKAKIESKIEELLAEIIDNLITCKRIININKLDNIATDALINFNECNDKCDTMVKDVEELKEQVEKLKTELEILRDGAVSATPAQIVDEWLNGKEA